MKKDVLVTAVIVSAMAITACNEKVTEPKQISPITKTWFSYASDGADSVVYTPVDSLVAICFEDPLTTNELEEFALDNAMLRDGTTHMQLFRNFFLFRTEAGTDIGWLLALLRADQAVRFAYPVFAEGDCAGDLCGLRTAGNEIILKFESEVSYGVRDSLFALYDLHIKSAPDFPLDFYVLVQEYKSDMDVFDVSNALYERGVFHYCSPNMVSFFVFE